MAITRAAQVDKFLGLIMSIPAAEQNEDGLDIALRVLEAADWESLNMEGSSLPQSKDMVGRTVKVYKIMRHESDKNENLPWYFTVDSEDVNGRPVRWQTGAATIMGQLAMLHAFGNLPAVVTITASQTRSGHDALALRIEAVH